MNVFCASTTKPCFLFAIELESNSSHIAFLVFVGNIVELSNQTINLGNVLENCTCLMLNFICLEEFIKDVLIGVQKELEIDY
jgi:hypothetical protein